MLCEGSWGLHPDPQAEDSGNLTIGLLAGCALKAWNREVLRTTEKSLRQTLVEQVRFYHFILWGRGCHICNLQCVKIWNITLLSVFYYIFNIQLNDA